MLKKFTVSGLVVGALMATATATPAFARDMTQNLGEIPAGNALTAQFIHRKKGATDTATTETYASDSKAFSDNVLFDIANTGAGTGVYTVQFLRSVGGKILKNVTNGFLTLQNVTTGEYLYNHSALTSGAQFVIPFTAGSYQANVQGNASGSNGGDYQITFAAPVPEPAVVGSMGAGLLLAGFVAKRRRRKTATA